MWTGSTGIHLLHRQVSKPVLRNTARLRSKLYLQGWQIMGRGRSDSGLGDGNPGTARQSAVANQLRGQVCTTRRFRLGSAFFLSHLQPN